MPLSSKTFSSIALAKEIESPENPEALEKRVALIPTDVGKLTKQGIKVFVEYGAGEGIGFTDTEYQQNNASMQTSEQIYRNKDLIIKFKGPSLSSIKEMSKGCTLFCMAHFHSYPNRAKLLQDRSINVIAMEEIYESPKVNSNQEILGRRAMNESLKPFFENNTIGSLDVRIIGWSERLRSAVRRCGNRNPRSLQIISPTFFVEELSLTSSTALYFYDSASFKVRQDILNKLKKDRTHLFDLSEFERQHGEKSIADYRVAHPPLEFGLRRIQCLHETGQAGARYGVKLLQENKPALDIAKAKAVVLGYGNVAQGALHELYTQGIKAIHVLGRSHTSKGCIDFWLKDVDLVVNGAEQPPELRGQNFLVTNQHIKEIIPDQSVVIDLVGGSRTNRSPVEAVISCNFLTEPCFVQDGVIISALWGWPMMGMMRETAIRYSGQIIDVLIGHEKLINGLHSPKPNVQRALVCGPFY